MTEYKNEHAKAISEILGTCGMDHPEAAGACADALGHLDQLTTDFDTFAHDSADMAIHSLRLLMDLRSTRSAVKLFQELLLRFEKNLRILAEVQQVCREDDAEGPHYLGSELFQKIVTSDLDVFKGDMTLKERMGL